MYLGIILRGQIAQGRSRYSSRYPSGRGPANSGGAPERVVFGVCGGCSTAPPGVLRGIKLVPYSSIPAPTRFYACWCFCDKVPLSRAQPDADPLGCLLAYVSNAAEFRIF